MQLCKIDLLVITAIAKQAGRLISEVYDRCDKVKMIKKDDGSLLTEADLSANRYICQHLSARYPKIPIISEELQPQLSFEERKKHEYLWLVDPLDGTKEFVKRNGDFTVNIALVHDSEPVLGVVYAPVTGELYYGQKGKGAFVQRKDSISRLSCDKKRKNDGITRVVVSRSHLSSATQAYLENLKKQGHMLELMERGSSLKICLIAEGRADFYPRLGPTMEWDTAAAHAILKETGKELYVFDSHNILDYNKTELLNPWFVAR